MKKQIQIVVTLFVMALMSVSVAAQSSGGPFTIEQSVIAGGGRTSTDTVNNTLSLTGTIGQPAAGTLTQNGSHAQIGGFWNQELPAAPTAAGVSISGIVTTPDGAPLGGVVMALSGSRNARTITNAAGNYVFNDLEANGFYVVTPLLVNYSFAPSERAFSLIGNRTDAIFTAISGAINANPLDTTEFFVRQQYLNFLDREPDQGGFEYWSDQINRCNGDAACIHARRIDVAAAFFLEQEFQQSGSFIYNLYEGALSRRPAFAEYSIDRQQVVGGPSLEAEKQAFAEGFAQRAEFMTRYQASSTAEGFVDSLLANLRQSSGVDLGNQRDSLISRYNTGANQTESRSVVLRDLTESAAVRDANYNAAFVLTEYFGYLRRDPDRGGYDFWLNALNTKLPNDASGYRAMVCAFITAAEYQKRFSVVVTHSNQECGP